MSEQDMARRACDCTNPDPVMQADGKYYCHKCSFETGARPSNLEPEDTLRRLAAAEQRVKERDHAWKEVQIGIGRVHDRVIDELRQQIADLRREMLEARENLPACRRQHLLDAPLIDVVRETVSHLCIVESQRDALGRRLAALEQREGEMRKLVDRVAGALVRDGYGGYRDSFALRDALAGLAALLAPAPVEKN